MLALLIAMVSSKIADIVVEPEKLAKNVFVVEGIETAELKGVDVTAVGPEPIEPLLAKADVQRGQIVAKKCLQCHTFEKGGANKIGPNLYGIIGQKIAAAAGYAYSKAFTEVKGTWDFKHLNELLYKPSSFARGTKMSFAGLQKAQDRADVIVYLNSLSDSPQPLPQVKEESTKEMPKSTEKETKETEKVENKTGKEEKGEKTEAKSEPEAKPETQTKENK